jgi:hypothetical protein
MFEITGCRLSDGDSIPGTYRDGTCMLILGSESRGTHEGICLFYGSEILQCLHSLS